MSRILLVLFLGVVALSGLTGCEEQRVASETQRLEGGLRILIHERRRYTIFVQAPNGAISVLEFTGCPQGEPTFTADVPIDKPEQIEYRTHTDTKRHLVCNELIAVHLHSVKEIGGGGWDHGKHGRGQTNVIE